MGTLGRGAAREGSWGPGDVGDGQVLPVPLRPSYGPSSDHTQSTGAHKRAEQERRMEPTGSRGGRALMSQPTPMGTPSPRGQIPPGEGNCRPLHPR